jgi:serine/threonine-protein kinase RsbW
MPQRPAEWICQITSDPAAVKSLTDAFTRNVERQGYDADTTFAVVLGFAEVLTNAFKHGNRRNPDKCITVYYRLDHARVELEVRDEGCGFDPGQVPDPTDDEGLARPSGRGVLLIRSLFDEVRYLHGGRSVQLIKRIRTRETCAA